jgi:hypothetical protein
MVMYFMDGNGNTVGVILEYLRIPKFFMVINHGATTHQLTPILLEK